MTKMNHDRANRNARPKSRLDARPYGMGDVLPFGRHAGRTVKAVIADDPAWLRWAAEKIPNFELTTDVLDVIIGEER